MTEFLAEHWILSIVVTIVLGAVGSGLWEAVLKPLTRKVGNLLFTLLTFGAKQARDSIYKSAAMGHHELPSLYILLILLSVGSGVLIASQARLYVAVYVPAATELLLEKCNDKEEKIQKECVREAVKQNIMPRMQVVSLVFILFTVFILYRFITINRTNLVITYYGHCLKAVRPFLTEIENMQFEQRYALMTTKEDFVAIIGDLKAVAESNKAVLPVSYL